VTQPTNIDKDWRIRTILQPVIADGRLFIRDEHMELKQEIINFPMSPTKDIIDALASAVKLLPATQSRAQKDQELERRLAYLRDSGAPADYIMQVARGVA
jgi:phage terminase large subunit-like protein